MKQDNTFDRVLMIILGLVMAAGVMSTYCVPKAEAAEFPKARDLSLDVGKFMSEGTREPYLNTPSSGALYAKLDLNWDIDLACGYYPRICWFWDNTIHSMAGQNRFRYVSWEFRHGLNFGKFAIFHSHHSEHSLDEAVPDRRFPVYDAVMLRINFLSNGR